ncbi:hypothetical protein FA15DRAFT_693537 [Coprinopsis marcescibilis]|uniref:Nephrocystin 3-like N-terminal domain-containing protein n=1 Tax=Coprinopsis marcescibilis TaxID=230819 RepID=A0A5C3KYL3_COPMA|nr:hypothetical protein FA15DRAFT_693537 [Coprinopsis marcescibilis]
MTLPASATVGSAARVMLVGGPAGSGKSALAHTICKDMDEKGILVSSFFFSQMGQNLTSEDFMAAFIRGLSGTNHQIRHRIGEILLEKPTMASASAITQFQGLVLPVLHLLPADRTFVVGIDALDEQTDDVILDFLSDYVPQLPATFKFVLTTRPDPRVMRRLEKQSHIHIFSRSLTGSSSQEDLKRYALSRLSKTEYHDKISEELLDEFVSKAEGLFLWAETVLNHIDNSYDPPAELADILKGASRHWMEAEGATKKLESLYEHILSKLEWTDARFVEKYTVIMGALVTLMEPMSASGLANLYSPDGISEADIHRICTYIRPLLQDYSRESPRKVICLLHLSVKEFLGKRATPPYLLDYDLHHFALSRLSLITIKKHLHPQEVPSLKFTEGEWVWDLDGVKPTIPVLPKEDILEHLWYACRYFGKHELSIIRDHLDDRHATLLYETVVKDSQFIVEVCSSIGGVTDIVSLRNKAQKLVKESCDPSSVRKTAQTYFAVARCMYPQEASLVLVEEAIRIYRPFATKPTDSSMEFEFAMYLCWFGMLLSDRRRSISGGLSLQAMEEALTITHRLVTGFQTTPDAALGSLLLLESLILSKLSRYEDSLQVDINSVELFRRLEAAQPTKFGGKLARVLHNTADNLIFRGSHKQATPYIVEAIKLRRSLARDDPDKYEVPLSESLLKYVVSLIQSGKAPDALEFGEEALAIRRRLAVSNPSQFDAHLPAALVRVAWILRECGRHDDAIHISAESVQVCRRLAKHDSAAYEELLAASLHSHALCLSMTEATWIDGVQVAHEAVDLRRRLALEDRGRFSDGLAESLFNLAYDLDQCGRSSDAVPFALESVEIRRFLAEKNLKAHEPSLATSLHYYALYLSKSAATLEDSIQFGQEAVSIRRQLAQDNPQNFREDLAQSLLNLAWDLDSCNRTSEAVPISLEYVRIRRQLAELDPSTNEPLLASSLHFHALYLSKTSGTLEDSIEYGRNAVAIRRRLAADNPDDNDIELARSLRNLALALHKCNRNIDAIPFASESLEIYRQLAGENPETHNPSLADSLHSYAVYLSKSSTTLKDSIPPAREAVVMRRLLASDQPQLFGRALARSLINLALTLVECGQHLDAAPLALESVEIRRALASEDPTEHEASLAESLHVYAFSQSQSPQTLPNSIPSAKEAVDIRRRLALANPNEFEEKFVLSLSNLAIFLSNSDQDREAIPIFRELVGIKRGLVQKDPTDEPLHDLANNLHNYSICLLLSGNTEASIQPMEESVGILRRLVSRNPSGFEPVLAYTLFSLSGNLSECSRFIDGASASQEAVDMYRRLVEKDQATYEPNLGLSLINLAWSRESEALVSAEESLTIHRRTALADQTKFKDGLLMALGMVAFCLNISERYQDSLPVIIDGLATHPQAAQEMTPRLLDRQFGGLRKAHAESLIGLGREKEAITPLQEAIIIYRRLLDGAPMSRLYGQELQKCTQILKRISGNMASV